MKNKNIFTSFFVLILLVGTVLGFGIGYIHENGSKILFDEEGNISGIIDTVKMQCRFPTSAEKEKNDYIAQETLGQCLTSKGDIFYGAYWCPHCAEQKRLLGDDLKNVNYYECEDSEDHLKYCMNQGIKAYPTWEINGKMYEGTLSLKQLSNLSGCPL